MNPIDPIYFPAETGEQEFCTRPVTTKLWGMEELIANTASYCGKKMTVLPGYQCSLHYHVNKEETFLVTSGLLAVEYWINGNEKIFTVLVGWRQDSLHLKPGTPHRFWCLDSRACTFFEFSSRHDDLDVVRIEDSREIPADGKIPMLIEPTDSDTPNTTPSE